MAITRIKVMLCVVVAAWSTALAQNYQPLPPEYDGSMMPYDFARVDTAYAIPDSLEAVHISYVARHGARYLSSESKILSVEKKLSAANLSAEGEAFMALLRSISQATDGRWGQLSAIGISEEQRLGAEMAKFAPPLLSEGKAVSITTFVPRVVMTAYEFNHALELKNTHLELYTSSGHQNDSLLYFFDYYPGYKAYRESGAWIAIYEDYVKGHISPEPARHLFANNPGWSDDRLRSLTMDMYAILQGCRASGLTAPTTQWMTEDEYRECWLASNLKHYLRNTPNNLNPHCTPSVAPLVRRIIADADSAINADEPDNVRFSGYFGHAETLLPLFSVLRLPGFYLSTEDYDSIAQHWRLQDLTPLGANVAMVFMRPKSSASDVVYVTIILNGRPVSPIPGRGTLIPWDALKSHWLSLI